MNLKMLTKFVVEGMKKNKKTLIPFLIAVSITVLVFYILTSLAFSPYLYHNRKEAFYGAQTIAIFLEAASQIVGIFAVIFLFYADQFVMRERKREIGLYGILGLSKKHITYIIVLETMIKMVISVGAGILVGTFLNKLMLLTLYKIVDQPPVSGILFTPEAAIRTLLLFLIIFIMCFIYNVSSVNVANPIELLKSNKTGEKEPKVKVGLLIVGVVTLVYGYYKAITCKTTSDAVNGLFGSITLVICGTYCLFITGSIFFLKMLKKNKKFYYKTKNFISVSSLIYRMKHNAAGLASICVLSTGVILLMTCAVSLMMLGEQNIERIYKNDIKLVATETREEIGDEYYINAMNNALNVSKIKTDKMECFKYWTTSWKKTDIGFEAFSDYNSMADMYLMSLEDYNKYADTKHKLNDNEVLVYSSNGEERSQLNIFGSEFKIVGNVDYDSISATTNRSMVLFETYVVVFQDKSIIKEILSMDKKDMFMACMGCDIEKTLTDKQMEQFKTQFDNEIGEEIRNINGKEAYSIEFKQVERAGFYNMYGGAFFVGIFLAVLFLMATVMIIYYKQMSEGYEDQRRYQILSCVGLAKDEIKATIKRQVMIVFFLPVVTAIIHMIVASNIIRLFLKMILVVDVFTFHMSILIVSLVFLIVYAIVYKITSVQYYKIVNA